MTAFSAIDLALLPPPTVVEALDYETILADLKATFQALYPDWTADLESEPVVKVLEVAAYRELLLRQRVNDAARAVLLATAVGADLDHVAALFGVARLVVDPGDPAATPPVAAAYEEDDALRRRAQLALEGITTAGSEGSYIFHALSADARVADVSVASPAPGQVDVVVLSTDGDGVPDAALMSAVDAALNAATVRPLTDNVTVVAATVQDYTVTASLTVYSGPDPEVVRQAAEAAVTAVTAGLRGLGKDVALSALYAALHQPGVHRVALAAPVADITCGPTEAANCTAIAVTVSGTGY